MDFSLLEFLESVLNVSGEHFVKDSRDLKYLKLLPIAVKDFKLLKELIVVLEDFMVLKLLEQGLTELEVIILKSSLLQNSPID